MSLEPIEIEVISDDAIIGDEKKAKGDILKVSAKVFSRLAGQAIEVKKAKKEESKK